MTPTEFLGKADRALAGARVLLAALDYEGACSRTYYAMFDAARAASLAVDPDRTTGDIKTHRGVIAAFGKDYVLTGRVDAELGRSFNRVQNLRLSADYIGDTPSRDDARKAIEQAGVFVEALRPFIHEP